MKCPICEKGTLKKGKEAYIYPEKDKIIIESS